ncbi:transcription-repair coupling factor [Limosilactobacillus fermentum]|uniref:transcription-repair coupling factor n=1 Tax=Limosilactobacillus fermentum TaxID=1613 RepID=UPI001FB6D383|nr:transcription-repair coupling factor [Limosilactobacillus fermentum]UOG13161.1 transcription-repair coupling factor [Limosilactobacillus fermentum]
MKLTELAKQQPAFSKIKEVIDSGQRQLITGVSGSAKTLLLAALQGELSHPQLVVCDSLYHMQELVADLENLLGEDQVFAFPVEEVLATEVATASPDYRLQRVQALNTLLADQAAVVVTDAAGLRRRLPKPGDFQAATLTVEVGGELDPTTVGTQLMAMGYQRQKMVLKPGDFAMRGSIVDIYALNTAHPVRIDLFDTEVDSLRYFDAESQRSVENIRAVTILPATDFIAPPAKLAQLKGGLQDDYHHLAQTADEEERQVLFGLFDPVISALDAGQLPVEMLEYADRVYEQPASLLDYLPAKSNLVLDDWGRIKESAKRITEQETAWLMDKVAAKRRVRGATLDNGVMETLPKRPGPQTYLALFQKGLGQVKLAQISGLATREMQRFFSQLDLLKGELKRWQSQGVTVVIMANSPERRNQVATTLADFGVAVVQTAPDRLMEHQVQLVAATLANGFEMPPANLVVITEAEMFKQVKNRRPRAQKLANAERIKSYTDLKPGDYVVHVNHGIGLFAGIKTMEVDGVHQDYMVLDYRDNAQIFVPVTQLNLVQKYVSAESKTPRLNRLGGVEWAKTKRRVAAKIEDIADDLVDLYAKRETEKGFAFPKDDYLQEKFDDEFPYAETKDQLQSIQEIKADMERPRPMDRLLVGDVGYGKTEVALRAIFKAVAGGKQVAFLVPTTILAQQHYDTMKARFEGFPVTIALMSRFKTAKELKETDRGLLNGEIDIVVGTHRILSKDVQFKDLGLLIVDEEQRFGVKHKERLKQLKANVDVLTLTATPIPRTLHMSMMGVRDLSVLETPPTGRYPIQTYVLEQNGAVIRDGILREMQRGGQVYYLHNRVHDIERVVAQLAELVPEARIGYIHGQMSENELEGVLYDFIRGEYDVLVTTSIIETGVDIANVNTLFVEDADRLGLAQLYQIRGRIGRSNRVAYAYFMYQENKVLTEQGEKRLAAIRDFTELGSGFKIAMRDLSIRGAGNLLGKQQHGFIDSVGYDLYTEMLADAVATKQGKKRPVKSNAEVELGVEAYLPSTYVDDQRQKIELYKQIRRAKSEEELTELAGDLIDRFGDYQTPVANLLTIGTIKLYADQAMLSEIERKRDNIYVNFTVVGSKKINAPQIIQALAKTRFKATMDEKEDGAISLRLVIQPKMTEQDWLNQLLALTSELGQRVQEANNEQEGETKQ